MIYKQFDVVQLLMLYRFIYQEQQMLNKYFYNCFQFRTSFVNKLSHIHKNRYRKLTDDYFKD